MNSLTPREAEALASVRQSLDTFGEAPTRMELAAALGVAARSAADLNVGWWRKVMGRFTWHEQVRGLQTWREASQAAADIFFSAGEEGKPPTVIVLTIAHLDHTPENCEPDNLRALCQRHHLAHDEQHHRQTAYATRRARANTAELF